MEVSGVTSTGSSLIATGGRLMTLPSETSYREIILTRGQVALVDDGDYDSLIQNKWCADWNKGTRTFYAIRKTILNGKKVTVRMHREILGLAHGYKRDGEHINGDTLDNRRDNLRIATRSQNARNRGKQSNNKSGYKGVHFHKASGKWIAEIGLNGKHIYLGLYSTPQLAHEAYCKAAEQLHGEYARTS